MEGDDNTGLYILGACAVLFICAIVAFVVYKKNKSKPVNDFPPMSLADQQAFFASGGTPTENVDCQAMSNGLLSWKGHKGMAALPDWAGFTLQKCPTYPQTYTSNIALLTSWYSANSNGPTQGDPFLGESQSIDSGSATNFIGNPVVQKHIVVTGDGGLAMYSGTDTTGDASATPVWKVGGGNTSATYTLKFDANNSNAGNLCVFPKGGSTPVWCMLPQITLTTSGSSTDGSSVNVSATQQAQLSAGQFKNNNDTATRFMLLKDDGTFCMYRGTPGAQQGDSILCKNS